MNYTMPQLLKDQWVDALLSGQYRQGIGSSYNHDTRAFCVVGVMMDVIAHTYPHMLRWNPMIKWWVSDTYDTPYQAMMALSMSDSLTSDCITMNDIKHMSFTDIAHWINEHVEGV